MEKEQAVTRKEVTKGEVKIKDRLATRLIITVSYSF